MIRLGSLAVILASLLVVPAQDAWARKKDGLPTAKQVAEEIRPVYAELATNSDPAVRRAVYYAELALGKKDRAAAIVRGLGESDWEIKQHALGEALSSRDRKLKKAASATLLKLLESGEEEERKHGHAILAKRYKKAQQLKMLQGVAKTGTPDARAEARSKLLARGGKVAWKVIEAGLAEGEGEPEYTQAVAALQTFRHPSGVKWAKSLIEERSDMGELARRFLVEMKDKRAGKALNKSLKRFYDKSAEFEQRLFYASVLGRRGYVNDVTRTLIAGLRYSKKWARPLSWQGLRDSRDLKTFKKLAPKILTVDSPEQAEPAYGWMAAWAQTNADPKIVALLQRAARSDRRLVRMNALKVLKSIKHRPSFELFADGMREGQMEIRLAAAEGMASVARVGDERRLAKFLTKEPNVQVKLALIQGLANIGTPDIVKSLQFVLTNRNKELKMAAAEALAATGTPKAATLFKLLKRDPDLGVRFFAWTTLLRLDKKGTEAEFQATALSWLKPDHVKALADNKKTSLDVLAHIAMKGNDSLREVAIAGLQARGEKAGTRLLSVYERCAFPVTSAAALTALSEVRRDASVATYRKALDSKHSEVRGAAYWAIGKFGPRALMETCLQGLTDKDPLARAKAAYGAFALSKKKK